MPSSIRSTQRLTIRDVAIAAGVSTGTVSRVIGGSPRVATDTRARVMTAMQELGFQPNAAARSMRTNVTKTIGLLIPDILSPTFARVAAGAESVLSPAGYMLLIGSSNRSSDQEVAFLQTARQRQMDGVIASICNESAADVTRELELTDVPTVVLDRAMKVQTDIILSEHSSVMKLAVAHLLSLGHRRIAYMGPSLLIRPSRERILGYRAAHAAAGVEVDERLLRCGNQSADFGEIETTDLLTMENPPTALIGGSGDIFYGVIRALRMLQLSIPEQISVIGVDDTQFADLMGPPISVITRDMFKIGALAAQLVLDRISDPERDLRRITLPSSFTLRNSTAGPARADTT